MAQELTGNTVASTYKSLIKVGTNTPLGTSLQTLSDGDGNDLPLQVSDAEINITGTLNTTDGTLVVGPPSASTDAATKGYTDGAISTAVEDEETRAIAAEGALQSDIDTLNNTVTLIQGWELDGIPLSDNIDIVGAGGVTVTADLNNSTITIDGSGGGGGGSDSFNTITVPNQPDVVAASGNDTLNFIDGDGISMTTDNTTKTITFDVDSLGNTTLSQYNLWIGDASGVPQETQRIALNNLPTITNEHVWKGGAGGVPVAVNQNTLSVSSAVNATDSANIKVDSITSGTYRLLVSDTGVGAGAYTRAKSDTADGLTFNTSGDILSTGAFTATNNVTAGGALIGASLDVSGSADIDGNLSLGAIGDVEGEIDDLNTFVTNYNEFSQIVTESAGITMDDTNYSTYKGKTIIITNASAVDVELDFTSAPVAGDEFYVVQGGAGAIGTINYLGAINSAAGSSPTTRVQWSGAVFKYLGSGDWLVMGDIE